MSAPARVTSDVCVIGGGPAGSSVARRLAALGHEVCLVERCARPRPHLAASLPSSILPLLEVLGVRDRVEAAGYPRPARIVVWWADASPTLRTLPGPPGFHVERGSFDRLLLRHAEACGVRVFQPAQAMRPERMNDGRWRVPLRHRGILKEVVSRFVVDAAGGRSPLGGRRRRVSAPLLALCAQFKGVGGRGVEGRVEAGESEWFWYAPLGGGRAVAAVFVDPKRISLVRREGVGPAFERLLGQFRLCGESLRGEIEGAVEACDASSRYAEEPAGDGFIRVGDASFSPDPLSSQGILSAVASALQAAAVLNTWARRPANADAATRFYRERQRERVLQHSRKAAAFYAERDAVCDRPFWRERAASDADEQPARLEEAGLDPACRIRLSGALAVESVPVLQGDLVETAPAVIHDNLARPVAFLGEEAVVPLLRQVRPGQTPEAVVRTWSERLPAELGWEIMHWLWRHRIVVPAPGLQHPADL